MKQIGELVSAPNVESLYFNIGCSDRLQEGDLHASRFFAPYP